MTSIRKSSKRICIKSSFIASVAAFAIVAFAQTAYSVPGSGSVGAMQIQNDSTRVYVNGVHTLRPDTIRPETIASVSVLTGDNARGRYPEMTDSEKCVIEIWLRKPGDVPATDKAKPSGPVTIVGAGTGSSVKK